MAITGKRKLLGKEKYKRISPELIELQKFLDEHELEIRQLIAIGILVGTDYKEGVKGIGPKRALKLVKGNGRVSRV